MTRRSVLKNLAALAVGAAAGVGGQRLLARNGEATGGAAVPAPPAETRLRALSLRSYQEALRASFSQGGGLAPDLQNLNGLNVVHGFIVEGADDVILFGEQVASLPALELDDLLVAARNAFQSGGPEYLTGPPGCTIDPKPGPDPWTVQVAKVLGMPATAPMGERHLQIDYDMKKAAAGLTGVAPSSLAAGSVFDYGRAGAGVCEPDNPSVPTSSVNRFWYCTRYPVEKPRYLEEGTVVYIQHPVNVQLQTEQEFLRGGIRVGAAPAGAPAMEFAKAVTERLGTDDVPAYVRLRGDFRVVELGKLLRFRNVSPTSLNYLLHECPMRAVPAPKWVGGIRRLESGEAVCDVQVREVRTSTGLRTSTSETVHRYRREFRGGVGADVVVTAADFGQAGGGRLARLRQDIIRARPSAGAVAWFTDSNNV